MTSEKPKIIEEILKLTKADPSANFDKLLEKSESYLKTLLKICQKLNVISNS